MRVLNTAQDFQDAMKYSETPQAVVVDFYADWCGPCRMVAPQYESLSQASDFKGVLFAKVNTDMNQTVSQQEGVTALPTFKIYVNRVCVSTVVGPRIDQLKSALETHYVRPIDISVSELATNNSSEVFEEGRRVLMKIADNILAHPLNVKYRSLKLTNQIVERSLLPCAGAIQCLYAMGFQDADDKFELAATTALGPLRQIHQQLSSISQKKATPKVEGSSPALITVPSEFPTVSPAKEKAFLTRVLSAHNHVLIYNDEALQAQALEVMNLPERKKKARSDSREDLVVELLRWFKQDFFSWMDKPDCPNCQQSCTNTGSADPTSEETRWLAGRVELYRCHLCSTEVRFPRYNHPGQLLRTRTGRCGEWANCFTLCLTAAGIPARYVLDWTDHVWCEVLLPREQQGDTEAGEEEEEMWYHCDPCEQVINTPLVYEAGWGKKLTYVIAYTVGSRAMQDVTWRYTAHFTEVLSRRSEIGELSFVKFLLRHHRSVMSARQSEAATQYRLSVVRELASFLAPAKLSTNPAEAKGRTTGSEEWRTQRGEMGTEIKDVSLVPTKEELDRGEVYLRYNCARDEYERGPPTPNPRHESINRPTVNSTEKGDTEMKGTIEVHSGWQSQAASWHNISRKSERDWKMVYLSREEGCSAEDEGQLSWTIDLTSSGRKVDEVKVFANGATFESATVRWQICGDENCCLPLKGFLTTRELAGCSRVTLKATLVGGSGSVAWQQAQLCRQKDTDVSTFPLVFVVSLQPAED